MKKEVWNSDACRDQLLTLGGNVRRLRTERNLSIAALSKQVPIHASALQLLETGGRGADAVELRLLAEFFDVAVDELLGMGTPTSLRAVQAHAEVLDRLVDVTDRMDKLETRLTNLANTLRETIGLLTGP